MELNREDTLKFFNNDALATDVFLKKYAVTAPDGKIEEYLPTQMWKRMSSKAASVEKDSAKWEVKFYELLEDWKGVPQGSIMFALGNPHQKSSCSNCFVLPIKTDNLEGIFDCGKEMAKTYSYRGGVGTDLSTLRPDGAVVSNAARTSTGAWSFMDFYSFVTRLIGQHGRRGALMLTIQDTHPDLEKFITAKTDKTKVTGANISVKISDAFMRAVESGSDWTMSFKTVHEEIKKTVPARDIWDLIIRTATETAEPGLLFWDRILEESPADCYAEDGFRTTATNPCVTIDTWVMTSSGPQQVKDLIGRKFEAIVNGNPYPSEGFVYTGTQKIYEVMTERGYSVRCTGNHLIKTSSGWKEASSLKAGDKLVLNNHRGFTWNGKGSFNEGFLLGSLLGDGVFTEKSAKLTYWGSTKESMLQIARKAVNESIGCRSDCGSGSMSTVTATEKDSISLKSANLHTAAKEFGVMKDKETKDELEYTSSAFHAGFLRGWFDADGTVLFDEFKQSHAIRLSSIKLNNLVRAQRMLARLGISSTIYQNRREAGYRMMPDGRGGEKEYFCQAIHDLHVSKDNMTVFRDVIGFSDSEKRTKLDSVLSSYNRGPYKESFTTKVYSITDIGTEAVYDCTVPDVSEFDANGISVHNCAELPLPPYDACTLFSYNLTKYTRNDFTEKAYFDFDAFKKDVSVGVRFLDNVKEIDLDLMPLPEQKRVAAMGRRIGMGTHGLADALANLCIRYDSEEAIQFADKLYSFYAKAVYGASVELAKEKGPFPIFDAKKEKNNPFLKRIGFAGVPRRNIACLTCAPTGSVACICQTSSGVEPVFRNFYTRRRKITHNESLTIPKEKLSQDKLGDLWQEYDVAHHNVQRYLSLNGISLDDHGREKIELPDYFVESDKINWTQRVKIQATLQLYIDHSISCTCNMPKGTSIEEVKKVYTEAWKQGCKGFTVYVDGSRDGVLITNKECNDCIQKTEAPKRPKELPAEVHHITVKGEQYFVIVGLWNSDAYEVFAGKNGMIPKNVKTAKVVKVKRGHYKAIFDNGDEFENIAEHISDDQEAVTRLVSAGLRHGADLNYLVHQLEKTRGDLNSFSKAIARALKKHIADGTKVTGEKCSNCGSENMRRSEGCLVCIDCGVGKCS